MLDSQASESPHVCGGDGLQQRACLRPGELRDSFAAAVRRGGHTLLRAQGDRDVRSDFARSVVAGLSAQPRSLDCRFLYDARGSHLYEQITATPEYYPTRTEASILRAHAQGLRRRVGPLPLVELGSGSSVKTDLLLRAWSEAGPDVVYAPVDVSRSALRGASERIGQASPAVTFVGVHGTYQHGLQVLEQAGPALGIFLGSTLGNFGRDDTEAFLRAVAEALAGGGRFLLGVDLVKDSAVLEAAYDDAAGHTAAFTTNLFARMNRELQAGLDVSSVRHVARYSVARRQVEIFARFEREQVLRVPSLGRSFTLAQGEEVLVEVSRKFQLDRFAELLAECGLQVEWRGLDERGWFALLLLRRAPDA